MQKYIFKDGSYFIPNSYRVDGMNTFNIWNLIIVGSLRKEIKVRPGFYSLRRNLKICFSLKEILTQ